MDNQPYQVNQRKRPSSICPKCDGKFRFNENNKILICLSCGFEEDAKRERDKEILPIRSDEMLRARGVCIYPSEER